MTQTLREWLNEAPFSLSMSSGFFGFFAHAGVVSVLEQEELRPRRMSGSSAGALVTGLWSSGIRADEIRKELFALERTHFWDPWPGLGLLRGKLFREKLESLLPVKQFDQCATPVALSVFDLWDRKTRVIERGSLAQAIHASCALPVMFQPVWIDGHPCTDGGVLDRPGMDGMPEGERILYHHLASKSPWRRAGDPALKLPVRSNTVTFVIEGITRVNPFALTLGQIAFDQAARAFRRALDAPIEKNVSRQIA